MDATPTTTVGCARSGRNHDVKITGRPEPPTMAARHRASPFDVGGNAGDSGAGPMLAPVEDTAEPGVGGGGNGPEGRPEIEG